MLCLNPTSRVCLLLFGLRAPAGLLKAPKPSRTDWFGLIVEIDLVLPFIP